MYSKLFINKVSKNKQMIDEDNYLVNLPIVKNLKELQFKKPVTFFVGENGTGKSTLLEAIAVKYGFNPEGGTRNFNFSTQDTHSNLYQYLTLSKGVKKPKDGFFLRAESFYNVASQVDKLDALGPVPLTSYYGGKSLHKQSHGESFMSLMLNRFGSEGLYILDEPEAALSPSRQMAMITLIHQLVKENSQLIIATHSPILLAYPNADLFVIDEKGINAMPYKETEHYILTKQFIDAPERMIQYLLEED